MTLQSKNVGFLVIFFRDFRLCHNISTVNNAKNYCRQDKDNLHTNIQHKLLILIV